MIPLFYVVALPLLLYISKFVATLFKNYLAARKTGLPLIIVPVQPNHLVWLIVSVPLRPILKRYAPSSIYYRFVLSIYGWEYHENRIIFRTLNTDSFMLVTCNKNEFYTINPEAVADICKRSNEFDKPPEMKEVADVFGPSLITSVGEAWSRQRKLITGIINERISRVVFEETWRQSRAMVRDLEKEAEDSGQGKQSESAGIHSTTPTETGVVYSATFPSMKRIASNVLSMAAYGMPQAFKTSTEPHADNSKLKFDMTECINIVIAAIIIAALAPSKLLSSYPSFLPGGKFMQRLNAAKNQYPGHVKRRIEEERKTLKNAGPDSTKSNLTSMLIQASEHRINEVNGDVKGSSDKKPQQQLSLSEHELQGNLFVFTTAGFETTANALTYALVSLMAEPKWQDWIFEEIDELFSNEETEVPDYVAFYPKALRCLALMMEVLRLHPPVVHLARSTPKDSPSVVKTSQRTYNIPPDSHIYVPFTSLHTDPKTWRNLNLATFSSQIEETVEDVFAMTQDEYLFRPSRWINRTLKEQPDGKMIHNLFQPPRGCYMPFSGGPRICPGQKMAQVEFVSVILALFKDYRIEAVKRSGESDAELHTRMRGVLKDSHAELTMVMERLHEVEVRFVRRGSV